MSEPFETQGPPPRLTIRSPTLPYPSSASTPDGLTEPVTPSECSSSMDIASDAGILDRQTEIEDKNSEYTTIWSNVIAKGPYSTPSCYEGAAVLLFSWAKEFDGMHVEEETEELNKVFRDLFHFQTKKVYLEPCSPTEGTNLQSKVSHMIANFISQFDGPNNLLIVYYAVR